MKIREINPLEELTEVKKLLLQLNPSRDEKYIEQILIQMSSLENYNCFGLYDKGKIIGIASGWTTIRIYCGKQLELDNVVINENHQSKGLGQLFFKQLENWAKNRNYQAVSLNTYVTNSRSHKFYFNQGLEVIGFHFQKSFR